MAINTVNLPQKKESGFSQISRLATAAGPLVALIPGGQVIGAGMTAGGVLGSTLTSMQGDGSVPQTAQLDSLGAMRRRQQYENPEETIGEALAALNALNLPENEYRKYKAPLYQALQTKGVV